MALCTHCGNEVDDPARCPICQAGRATPKVRRSRDDGALCPRCEVDLETQNMEGCAAFSCPDCRGIFFPEFTLETVLNKLRATCDPVDVRAVLQDFRDRFHRKLPETVRYKKCPVCTTPMTPSNYRTVSGVIVDLCGQHGTWVDEQAFAALADFICRGGDLVANEAGRVRARTTGRRPEGGPNLVDRLFGGGDG